MKHISVTDMSGASRQYTTDTDTLRQFLEENNIPVAGVQFFVNGDPQRDLDVLLNDEDIVICVAKTTNAR